MSIAIHHPNVGGARRRDAARAAAVPVRAVLVGAGFACWMVKPVGDSRVMLLGYALVLLGAVLGGAQRGFWIDRRIGASFLASVAVGTVGTMVGLRHANPGVTSEVVFFVVLPLVWLLIAVGTDLTAVRAVVNFMPVAGLVIGLLGSLYWLDGTGRASIPGITLIPLGQGLGQSDFGYELRFYPISTLVFLLPFLVTSLIVPGVYTSRLAQRLATPATATTLWLLFVSGRRAIFVTLVVSVGFGVLVLLRGLSRTHLGAERKRRLFRGMVSVAVASVLLTALTDFSVANLIASLRTERLTDSARTESGSALLASAKTAPIFGHGLGATVEGSVRSVDRPWNFELQYHLILNALGLVGFAVLALVALSLFLRTTALARAHYDRYRFLVPVIVGALSLVLANGTNPYLHTPGHYWMLFLLVVAANAVRREIAIHSR